MAAAGWSVRRGRLPFESPSWRGEPFDAPFASLRRNGRELFAHLVDWDAASGTARLAIDLMPTMDDGAVLEAVDGRWRIVSGGPAERPATAAAVADLADALVADAEGFAVG